MTVGHSIYSAFREKTLEHIFVAECLRHLWRAGVFNAEVLRADVDAAGYDIVMEVAEQVRHIQLKASFNGSRTIRQTINRRLGDKPSGCVVWIKFDPQTMDLGPFGWFGGGPGESLPSLDGFGQAKHTRGNAEGDKGYRRNSVILRRQDFEWIATSQDVIGRLFGPIAGLRPPGRIAT